MSDLLQHLARSLTDRVPAKSVTGTVSAVVITPAKGAVLQGEVRAANPPTPAAIEALLARGLLRHLAGTGPDFLGIAVPALSPHVQAAVTAMERSLTAGIAQLLTGKPFNWMVFSPRGGRVLVLPSWKVRDSRSDPVATPPVDRSRPLVFSDAAELLLKHLLFTQVSLRKPKQVAGWWGGTLGPYDNVEQLGERAGVSVSSAYRLMRLLWARGVAIPKQAALLSADLLLAEWSAEALRHPIDWTPLRPLYPSGAYTATAALTWAGARLKKEACAVLTGRHALAAHGIMKATGLPHLVTRHDYDRERLPAVLQGEVCDPAHAWVLVGTARTPRSAWAGLITRKPLPMVDLWQAALDAGGDVAEPVARLLA
jgi:hypothetical protein